MGASPKSRVTVL
ncbi:hypothetical protein V3C99_017616, partial [Haemonchus contortus]